nr:protein ILITYHIA [Tanacetum cinerariifolium]
MDGSVQFLTFVSLLHHTANFKNVVIPSSVKMLKRNPELVLESIGVLFRNVNLDLSKYSAEILPVVLLQVRHADEGRRVDALDIVIYLSQKASNPDAIESMVNVVQSIIGGSEGRLAFQQNISYRL